MAELMRGKRGLVWAWRTTVPSPGNRIRLAGRRRRACLQLPGRGVRQARPAARRVRRIGLPVDVDVTNEESLDACFGEVGRRWGSLDFVVHAIAFSDKNELTGRFINTTRETSELAEHLVLQFHDIARRASR